VRVAPTCLLPLIAIQLFLIADACGIELTLDQGTCSIDDRSTFVLLSGTSNLPGSRAVREVKFLITDILSDSPCLYLMNTASYPSHYEFYTDVLGWAMTLYNFNQHTYYPFNRLILAGSVLSHERDPDDSLSDVFYTMEFWPIDLLDFEEVFLTYGLVTAAMYCPAEMVLYHPSGQNQVNLYHQESELYRQAGIPVIMTDSLYGNAVYTPLNTGDSFGILREPGYTGALTSRDIPVFQNIPNTLNHVAGIITTAPQTPLSHVNLIARQNGVPNAYIPAILTDSSFAGLIDQYVRLEVRPDGFELERATAEEFNSYFDSIRPQQQTFPVRNLSVTGIPGLEEIRFRDWSSVGAKAANVAELRRCLPENVVPDGVAVPFYYYDEFMKANGLYKELRFMIDSPEFDEDPLYRQQALDEFRSLIELSPFPEWMLDSLGRITEQFPPGTSLRCRSSTNTEDLPCFNGAGLYRSYTHHPYEGHIATTIRQVWASLWTYRAFEEREFYRIDHIHTAMGVLIHPSYRNELANGVAVTQNVFDPISDGFYVNVQVGDDMVTNPGEQSVPDEFITIHKSSLGEDICEILYIGFSNRMQQNEPVLNEDQIGLLVEYLKKVQFHFSVLYMVDPGDQEFAMEVEFKITSDGELVVKQARPWIS